MADTDIKLPSGPEADVEKVHSVNEKHPTDAVLRHGNDADEAIKAFAGREGEIIELSAETNKSLLKKIDWHLMPIMCLVYGMNFLDKTTISYASIMGLKTDINLTGDDYQWLGSMFYFGYLAWEWPTNRLLQRLPLAKYSSFCIIMWGASLCCFAAVQNFSGAVAVRFFLGVFESAVTPGFALFTSQWYTRSEQGARVGIWFSFNGWAQILGGFLAFGIAKAVDSEKPAIEGWRILFLATGLFTALMGVVFLFFMPDNQLNAKWLTKDEQILAIERVRVNQQGIGNKHWKLYQLKEALTDPMTWAFVMFALLADIPNGGLSNFFSLLIESFGFSAEESLLYGTPVGAVEVVTLVFCGVMGDRKGQRILYGAGGMILALIGIVLVLAIPHSQPTARLVFYYLTGASACGFVALLSLISSNVAGYTKKTTIAAFYLIGYCVGNIIGPQTFRPSDAPNYVPAQIVIVVCWVISIADLFFIRWWCIRQNNKKAALRADPSYEKVENQEFLDLTDGENPEFIYSI